MKRKSAWLTYTACALTAAATLAPVQAEPAASPAPDKTVQMTDFSNVQVIAFPNGRVGFFNRGDGTLYIYSSSLNSCQIFKTSLLGEPFRSIKGGGIDLEPKR